MGPDWQRRDWDRPILQYSCGVAGVSLRRVAVAWDRCSGVPVIPVATAVSNEPTRSEEHTSELQSPCNLVCRLLLEKKKPQSTNRKHAPPCRSRPPRLPQPAPTIAPAARAHLDTAKP